MNPDTSEFLGGYNNWYNSLSPTGGAAEIEKLQGGKMKEWIEELKKCREYHEETNGDCALPRECCGKLIAEIESLETEIKAITSTFDAREKYTRKLQIENKQLQVVREAAKEVDWQEVWDIIHFFLLDEKTIEEKKSEIVKQLNQISKLKRVLVAKGKDEKVS